MTKPATTRDYENDGFVGLVYSDDGLKIVDRTATYNKRIDAFQAARALSAHHNSGGDDCDVRDVSDFPPDMQF